MAARVWPNGVPETEMALWHSLTQERRAVAERRVRALAEYEEAGRSDPRGHAQKAGVSVPRFYILVGKWRETRSIASVVPHGVSRKGKGPARVDDDVVAAARSLIAEHPGAGQETLAQALFAQLGERASLSFLRRLVASEKAGKERERLGGDAGFGRVVLIDTSALDLVVRDERDTLDWAAVGLLVDEATGLILGRALGSTGQPVSLQREAARDAERRLRTLDLPGGGGGVQPRFVVVVGSDDADAVALMREIARLHQLESDVEVVQEGGARRFGRLLQRAVGRRIGPIELRPRFTHRDGGRRPGEDDDERAVGRKVAELIMSAAIEAHNSEVLTRPITAAVAPSRLADELGVIYPASA